jgi:predicted TIM-barrel fold metal-dependent hydrolase
MNMEAIALPEELSHLTARITDIDSHEMLPAQEWMRLFGPAVKPITDYYAEHGESEHEDKNAVNVPDYPGDILPIDLDIVNVKGVRAPGAVDVTRRVEVMKAMGIGRQLMYPSYPAVPAMRLYAHADDPSFMPYQKDNRLEAAKELIDIHNEGLIASAAISDMIRPVPILYGSTPDEIIARAEYFISKGIKAVWLFPAGELPGDRSPAHSDLDPLWKLCAEADCAITVHVAGDGNFLATDRWQDAEVFSGYVRHVELVRSPWFLATLHLASENMLTTMVLGGVFERHPNLRFGVIECGSFWLGPLMERLDMWYGLQNNLGGFQGSDERSEPYRLEREPSFYMRRNVRVTPFVFENIAEQIQRYPGIEDMLCYSSDYPHSEGGKDATRRFFQTLKGMDEKILEKFFVTNGEFLLPD